MHKSGMQQNNLTWSRCQVNKPLNPTPSTVRLPETKTGRATKCYQVHLGTRHQNQQFGQQAVLAESMDGQVEDTIAMTLKEVVHRKARDVYLH
mmetsp:Transcript_93643/g.180136  ORF Transcript_93643/g.180136 Transcript_93643/m.180136 type:complete len:93 (-) Transcript_93643:208-486(-)